jgi:DNA-binding response OmpR family regulator
LFVLDWVVPGASGLEVLKHIRDVRQLAEPVMFLTSCSAESQIIEALNCGADDYCTKPLRPLEFLARINAVVRRPGRVKPLAEPLQRLFGYEFSAADSTVRFNGQVQVLPDKEFRLALFLFENADRAISRARLVREIWGTEPDEYSRSLDVHISRLRTKLNLASASSAVRLRPVYGFGYRLVTVPDEEAGDRNSTTVAAHASGAL